MSFSSEYEKLRKKRLEEEEKKKAANKQTSYKDSRVDIYGRTLSEIELAPVLTTGYKAGLKDINGNTLQETYGGMMAPIATKKTTTEAPITTKKDEKRTWFQSGGFGNGYDFGDVTKTIIGTHTDIKKNATAGILGMGEKAVDAVVGLAALVVKHSPTNFGKIINPETGKYEDFTRNKVAKSMKDFIAKDLYDEEAVAEAIVLDPLKMTGSHADTEGYSLLGEKSDSLVQSGAQLIGTIGLQAVGVPWFVTSGVTSYGGEMESALNEGATIEEANASALITAGAELLTEKISGGIKFGGKALDDVLTKRIARDISNKTFRTLVKLGVDMGGEGAEEVLSGALSAIGQKMTYEKDKDLSELFTTDEAFESFIGGSVLGGGGNVVNVVNSKNKGVDSVTGLTKNEQSVVDKVYKDRLAEAEENGKLTQRAKSKIYDTVLKDLDKGYISTDTIESILGGDTYKSYRETIDSEDALKQEYDILRKMEKGKMNDIQNDRLAELKGMNLEDTTKRDSLREQLDKEMFGLVNNSRLAESYNEKTRRGQYFEVDLSNYDKKYHDTIQRAINSKTLNNTNRTHELVDMIAKISADKGVSFDFTNNAKLKESGFAIDGKTINGFVTKDGITLNTESAKYLNSVVGHEVTHVLEGTELYTELQNTLIEYAKTKNDYQGRIDTLTNLYKGVEGADINAELTADLVGDYLFSDSDFISKLSTEHRNVFQKIYDEIKYLYKVATAGSKEARELEKVKKAFDKAYKESGKITDTKYSLTEYTQEEKKAHNDAVLNHFGKTYSWNETGYLLLDGTKLDLSGKHDGAPGGYRTVDHRDISDALGLDYGGEDYSGSLVQFMSEGNIRIIPEIGGINLSVQPTKAQEQALSAYISKNRGEIVLDIDDLKGNTVVSLEYPKGTQPSKVLNDIEQWFTKGIEPEVSNISPFRYSLSAQDSDGNKLTKEQQRYFKDSKVRDENGNLKVMYHGSQDAGFHVFDGKYSDDDISFFFVDRNDVAASYSGTTETYEAKTIRTTEDMNNFLAEIGYDSYKAVETDGKFELLENNEHVAYSDTAQGLYEEFCWYEGVGEGDANYKVYLNLKNPLIVDAEGRNWNNISREFSQEVYNRYQSLTAEEKAALNGLAEWGEYGIFRDEMLEARANAERGGGVFDDSYTKNLARAYEKLGGANANLYDAFSIASENFSEESLRQFAVKQMNTRDYAAKAKAERYDGVIFKNIHDNGGYSNGSEGASTVAIAFSPEQIKSVANTKPTTDPDIRYSLSREGEQSKRFGNYRISGEDVAYQTKETKKDIAPIREDVSGQSLEQQKADLEARMLKAAETGDVDTLGQLSAEHEALLAKIEKANNIIPDNFAPITEEEANALQSENLASLEDADAPPETEATYPDEDYANNSELAPDSPLGDRDIDTVGNRKVKAYMYENPEVKPFFQEEARAMLGELERTEKPYTIYNGDRKYNLPYEFAKDIPELIRIGRRTTPDIAYLRDSVQMSYEDIEKGLKAIIEDNGAENIAAAKKIEFVLDERLRLGYESDVVKIPANQDYINLLNEKQITEYNEESFRRYMEQNGDAVVPKEDIAPINVKATTKITAPIKETAPTKETVKEADKPVKKEKIAKIVTDEPTAPEPKGRKASQARMLFLDKQAPIEDLSLKTGNRELMAKADNLHRAESAAQRFIGKGADGVRALMDIKGEVKKAGLYDEFNEYLYHWLNVDRMSIESNAKKKIDSLRDKFTLTLKHNQIQAIAAQKITDKTTEKTAQTIREAREYLDALNARNLPVYGKSVTADISRAKVAEMESKHPEFKQWAEDMYGIAGHLRKMMVDGNVISQETADRFETMYPHYVPIHRLGKDGAAVNVPLDTRKTGVNAPIKRATGGNSDIGDVFKTLADRIGQTYRAVAKNSLGIELKNALGVEGIKNTATVDEINESFDNHEELLKEGKNGMNPTFTIFENGKRVEFEITEDLYDSLKPTNNFLAQDIKLLSTLTKIQRGILTEYNPLFVANNAIKDAQSVVVNSQHPIETYMNFPEAVLTLANNAITGKEGQYLREYFEHGGEDLSYYDNKKRAFSKDDNIIKKIIGFVPSKISGASQFIERVPRLAEYIASRKKGASIDVAMLDAARVTTNFGAGGDVAKWANRNGATFLNASIQGFNQQVRNVREAKARGLKGILQLTAKYAAAGLPVMLLNHLLWDDDEEYEELSDYIKDNYYIVGKTEDGRFLRIPKGRELAVIQNAFEQMKNLVTGDDDVDMARFGELLMENIAPNNPLTNNVFAPIVQAHTNKAWYGGDLVPTRLQDLPASEQYDESTDAISKWLAESYNDSAVSEWLNETLGINTELSPYRLNYLIDQYSGVFGDMLLPSLTPATDGGGIVAPWKDKFTTDGTFKNRNVSDFYDVKDELTTNAKSSSATDEDILKSKYINSVSTELGELYKKQRDIQNSDLSDDNKLAQVKEIQEQINNLAREGLSSYDSVSIDDGYATVGNRHYRLEDGTWTKISDKQLERQEEVTSKLGITPSEYWKKTEISYIPMKDGEYEYAYDNPEKYTVAKAVGGYERYKTYSKELYGIKADKDENGKSISGSRKVKVIQYLDNLDADYGEKIILFKSEYPADDTYNYEIVDYLNGRDDISYKEMETILKELGFDVSSDGTITWD